MFSNYFLIKKYMYEYSDNILITLNSDYGMKINGSMNSNVVFDFRGILQDDPDVMRCNISVLNAMIPCSFYNITSLNNKFNYGYYESSTYPSVYDSHYNNVTVPEGNYNIIQLIDALNNGFIANSDEFLNLSYDRISGKTKFSCDNSQVVKVMILVTSTMLKILGFDNDNYSTALASNNQTITSPYTMNLLGVKRISVHSTHINTISYSSLNLSTSTVLCTINNNSPINGVISYDNSSNVNKFILRVKEINCVDIQLKDENQNFLDLHNIPWTITLSLEIIRVISFPEGGRKTTFHDVIYKFHHKKHDNGQVDITDLKEIQDDEDNDLDVLLYKATIPN